MPSNTRLTISSIFIALAMIAIAVLAASNPLAAEADSEVSPTVQICFCPACAPGTPPEECQCRCSTPEPTPELIPPACLPGQLSVCPACAPGTPPEECQCTCVLPVLDPIPNAGGASSSNNGTSGDNTSSGGVAHKEVQTPAKQTTFAKPAQLAADKVQAAFQQVFGRAPSAGELAYWQSRTDKPSDPALQGAMRWHAQNGRTTPVSSQVAGTSSLLPQLNGLFRSANDGINPTPQQWRYWANRLSEITSELDLLNKMNWHAQYHTPWAAQIIRS